MRARLRRGRARRDVAEHVRPAVGAGDGCAALTGIDGENAPRLFAGAPSLPEAREMVLAILNPGSREATLCQTVSDDYSDTDCAPPLVVGHDLAHDLACLGIASRVPARRLRDTARYAPFERHTRKPYKLRVLAKELLNVDIQSPNQAHDPRGRARGHAPVRGESAVRAFFTSRRRDARDGGGRFVRRHDARGETKPPRSKKPNRKRGSGAGVWTGVWTRHRRRLAPLAPSHARSTAAAVAGVFIKRATREPKRALRDATNA